MNRSLGVVSIAAVISVIACGSSNGESEGSAAAGGQPGTTGSSQTGGSSGSMGAAGAGGADSTGHVQAAVDTATKRDACQAIAPFYWEIGDAKGLLVSGETGDGSTTASTTMKIASASKWIFGAYVVERFKDDPSMIDAAAMTMLSGYTSFTDCGITKTVGACFATGDNDLLTPEEVGHFHYNGGHFQKYGVDLDLGLFGTTKLASEIGATIGPEIGLAYWSPGLAGAVELSADHYALFLRKILTGQLAIAQHLGDGAVCTLPGTCPAAVFSPVPEDWHYGYGHWVEDDPKTGDGSFSSPGLFGFYPWIGAAKKLYGLVARYDPAHAAAPQTEATSYWMSVVCGRAIRAAFQTGQSP